MAEQFQNFFVTKLREACDAVATTIYVDTVPAITEGTLVLEYANSTKHEIIHFTGVSGYGLTGCTRGLEGTTAQSHSAGTDVRQNLTAGIIDKIINGVITTENIADGAVTADKIDWATIVYPDFYYSGAFGGKAGFSQTRTIPLPRAVKANERCVIMNNSKWCIINASPVDSGATTVNVDICPPITSENGLEFRLTAMYYTL